MKLKNAVGSKHYDASGIVWAKDIPPPRKEDKIPSHWGPFLYPASLHLLSGDTGVGKTTFGYNLALSLANGESFLGFKPSRPLRVLYYDLETPPLLRQIKLQRIANNERPNGLAFAQDFRVSEARHFIEKHHFDLLIIDTGSQAFQTQEEGDNSEANRQMNLLRKSLIKKTGVAILVFYHMAKEHAANAVYAARGASARPAAAEVVINVTPHGATSPANSNEKSVQTIKIEVVKNRWEGGNAVVFAKKIGRDRFALAKKSERTIKTQESLAESVILGTLQHTPRGTPTKEIVESGKSKGIPKPTIERALSHLVKTMKINRMRKGSYCLPAMQRAERAIKTRDGKGKRKGGRYVDEKRFQEVKSAA